MFCFHLVKFVKCQTTFYLQKQSNKIMKFFKDYYQISVEYLILYVPTFLLALIVLLLSIWIISKLKKSNKQELAKRNHYPSLIPFLSEYFRQFFIHYCSSVLHLKLKNRAMRSILTIVFFLTIGYSYGQEDTLLAAKDTAWCYSLKSGLNFSQTSFSDNWAGGGVGSVAIVSYFSGTALYSKNKITWSNELQMLYGIINQENLDTRKTTDRLFFDSKLGYALSKKWNYYASLSFLSQFAPGYQFNDDNSRDKISDFFAPAFITSSWGLEYTPNDWFWLRIGPFSPRITIVTDDSLFVNIPENYGVPIGENIRYEWLAFQLTAQIDKDIGDNLNIKSRYNLFANYEEFSIDKFDHFVELIATSQVTKFIDVSLAINLIYDKDQDNDIQSSQLFGIGLLYKIGTKDEK